MSTKDTSKKVTGKMLRSLGFKGYREKSKNIHYYSHPKYGGRYEIGRLPTLKEVMNMVYSVGRKKGEESGIALVQKKIARKVLNQVGLEHILNDRKS